MRFERLNRLDYVKIDAEGAEQEILDGGKQALGRYRAIIQAEVSGGHASQNTVFVPEESPKSGLIEQFGWRRQ